MSADIASPSLSLLRAENRRLQAQLIAAAARAELAESVLNQLTVEIRELRHHLSPKREGSAS